MIEKAITYAPPSYPLAGRQFGRKIAWAICIIVVVFLALAAVLCNVWHSKGAGTLSTAPVSVSSDVAGWEIKAEGERTIQVFGGRFAPGGVFFLPAGANFTVRANPLGRGAFTEQMHSTSWRLGGGELNGPELFLGQGSGGENFAAEPLWRQSCRAPNQPGFYELFWANGGSRLEQSLNVLVMTKAEARMQGGKTWLKVNGKSIGAYPDPAQSSLKRVRENAQRYQIPQYFTTITPETAKLHLGEDFELGQLVAYRDYRGPDGKKVYTTERHTDVVPLRPELIDKLIKLRQRLREKGVKVTHFWITSGFRTPEYNHAIGGAAFSRHCYGDAVDIVIDEGNNKRMDDLNGDGKIDRKDGLVIANACRELEAEGAVVPGGIGVYEWDGEDSVRCHVHIDCRGYMVRWGQIGSGRNKKTFVWWPKEEFQEEENGE